MLCDHLSLHIKEDSFEWGQIKGKAPRHAGWCASAPHTQAQNPPGHSVSRVPLGALAQHFNMKHPPQSSRTTWAGLIGLLPVTLLPPALLFGWAQRPPLRRGRCHRIRRHFVTVSSGEMSFRVLLAQAEYSVHSGPLCSTWRGRRTGRGRGRGPNQAFHPSVM